MPNSLVKAVVDGPLASFANSVGEHVYFTCQPNCSGPYYDVMELCGCGGIWQVNDLTGITSAEPHQDLNDVLAGFTQGSGSSAIEQVAYYGITTPGQLNVDLYVNWWTSANGWKFEDLNTITGAPSPGYSGSNVLTGLIR